MRDSFLMSFIWLVLFILYQEMGIKVREGKQSAQFQDRDKTGQARDQGQASQRQMKGIEKGLWEPGQGKPSPYHMRIGLGRRTSVWIEGDVLIAVL